MNKGALIRWYAAGDRYRGIAKQAEQQLRNENVALREEIDTASMFEEIVGVLHPCTRYFSLLSKVAPTDSTVLITGENGDGQRAGRARRPQTVAPFFARVCERQLRRHSARPDRV